MSAPHPGDSGRIDPVGVAADGPPLVIVHGTMDRATSFERTRRQAAALTGGVVTTYDRTGYATAGSRAPRPDPASHVADLVAIIGPDPAVVVGHSYGGVIALHAAIAAPSAILAVGVYEPPLPWLPWWPPVPDLGPPDVAAERFLRRMIGDANWDRLGASFRSARRAEGPALLADFAAAMTPIDWADIATPVHAAHGSDSPPHFVDAAVAVADAVTGATLTRLDGASHGAHLSHPIEFAAWMHGIWSSVLHDPQH